MDTPTNDFLWIVIQDINKEDFRKIEKKYRIHPLTTEDILESDLSREKVEDFDDYLFMVVKELHYNEDHQLRPCSISTIVFRNIALSFHSGHIECIEEIQAQLRQGRQLKKLFMTSGSDWTIYALADIIIDQMEGYASSVVVECDALEELVLLFNSDSQNDLLKRIGNVRKKISILRGNIWFKRELLTSLSTKHNEYISKEIKVYLRDVSDNVSRMEGKLSLSKETLVNLNQVYLARISVEIARASDSASVIMKKFSVVGTIFIPMSLVAGLLGMNVSIPGQTAGPGTHIQWFYVVIGTMIITTIVLLTYFRRRNWI